MLRFLGLEAPSDGVGRVVVIGGRQFRLHRIIAQGGHATIFEARDTASGEALVVKQVLAQDEEAAELAEREVVTHLALDHESILPCLGEAAERRKDGGAEFLVLLPLITSGHLWDFASSTPMRPLAKLCALEAVASALDHMHERCLAHLDVKLENVLVDGSGGAGVRFLLCDFG